MTAESAGGPEAAGLAGYCPVSFSPPDRRAPSRDTERAMSEENVEVVREGMDAINRRDQRSSITRMHALGRRKSRGLASR
jgi:hypothetical protein